MNWLGRGMLLAFASVLGLVLAEVGARLVGPDFSRAPRPDVLLGWSTLEYQNFLASHQVEVPRRRPRVLFLGDSYLAGAGLRQLDQRFTTKLQAAFAAEAEIGVLATGGWGTDQQLLAFREVGAAWQPDLVVLSFCASNDISNIVSHHHGALRLKPFFTLDEDASLRLHDSAGVPVSSWRDLRGPPPPTPWWMHSALLATVRHLMKPDPKPYRPDQHPGVDPRYKHYRYWEEPKEEIYALQPRLSWSPQSHASSVSAFVQGDLPGIRYQWTLFEQILGRLQREAEAVGAMTAVLLLPVIYNPRDLATLTGGPFERVFDTPDGPFRFRSAEPRDRLRKATAATGVELYDPTQPFGEIVRERDLLLSFWPDPQDRHFSAAGHALLAELMEPWLRSKLALPASKTH